MNDRQARKGLLDPDAVNTEFERRIDTENDVLKVPKSVSKKRLTLKMNVLEDDELREFIQTLATSAFMQLNNKFVQMTVQSTAFQTQLEKQAEKQVAAALDKIIREEMGFETTRGMEFRRGLRKMYEDAAKEYISAILKDMMTEAKIKQLVLEAVQAYVLKVLPK